jgi:hypothetical protein
VRLFLEAVILGSGNVDGGDLVQSVAHVDGGGSAAMRAIDSLSNDRQISAEFFLKDGRIKFDAAFAAKTFAS